MFNTLKHITTSALACALCALLAFSLTWTGPVYADAQTGQGAQDVQTDGAASAAGLQAQLASQGATDLNGAWSAQKGGTGSTFTISQSGSYYLSADLTATAGIRVEGEGIDVSIYLCGHALSVEQPAKALGTTVTSTGTAITVANAARVTVDGAGDSGAANGSIALSTSPLTAVVQAQTGDLTVRNVALSARSYTSQLSDLGTAGVSVAAGAATVDNVTVDIDLSNQARNTATATYTGLKGIPSAVFLDAGAKASTVSNVTATVTGSPVVALDSDDEVSKTEQVTGGDANDGLGNVYGVYSLSAEEVQVSQSTFNVASALGSAAGVYAVKARIAAPDGAKDAPVAVTATAGRVAAGAVSGAEGGIVLDAPLNFATAEGAAPAYAASIRSLHEGAFTLDAGGAGTSLTALVGTADNLNASTARIAAFGQSVAADARAAAAGNVASALTDGACEIAYDASGLYFQLKQSKAPVEVQHVDGTVTRYASAGQAVDAIASGETLRLLQDVPQLIFDKAAASTDAFTLDLNGHAVAGLGFTSAGRLTVTSSATDGEGATVKGRITALYSAATQDYAAVDRIGSSAGALALEHVSIDVSGVASSAYGVYSQYGSGDLSLNDVDITVQAGVGNAAAVYDAANVALSVANSTFAVSAYEPGVAVTGIAQPSGTTLAVTDSAISVEGTTGTAIGVNTAADATLTGSAAGGVSVNVHTTGDAAQIIGVRAIRAKSMALSRCSVDVSSDATAPSDGCWCLSAGGGASTLNAQWTLDGSCDFQSSTDTVLRTGGTPVSVGADFTNAGQAVTIQMAQSAGDVAVQVADGAQLPDALPFASAAESFYADYAVARSDDASKLIWTDEPVARNTATGASYGSLAAALSSAGAGQTVQVLRDCSYPAAVQLASGAVLDLAGHDVTVQSASSASAADVEALLYMGEGDARIIDSASEKGALNLVVGYGWETAATAVHSYDGILVAGVGSLTVDGATVNVSYRGSTSLSNPPAEKVVGADVARGSFALANGAALNVSAIEDGASFGATYAEGVRNRASDSTSAVRVDATASVTAANASPRISTAASYGTSGTTVSADAINGASVRQIDIDPASDLYAQVQQKFLQQAVYDDPANATATGSVHQTGIYYAAPITLDDGTRLFAFSDPVATADVGKKAAIKATHFFVQTNYDTVPAATGIEGAVNSAGATTVQGAVNATCDQGDATAVAANGAGALTVDGARLIAQASDDAYLQSQGSDSFDLRNYMDLGSAAASSADKVVYPGQATVLTDVKSAAPEASGIAAADGANVLVEGAVDVQAQGMDACDVRAAKVSVGAGFAPQSAGERAAFSVKDPSGANKAGAVFAVGMGGQALDPLDFTDGYGAYAVSAAADGSLTWGDALNGVTATFKVYDTAVSTATGLEPGATVDVPSASAVKRASDYKYDYELLGWSAVKGATTIDESRGDIPASAATVQVGTTVTYYAVFAAEPAGSIQVSFANVRDAQGGLVGAQQATVSYGSTLLAAGAAVPVPSDYTVGQTTYRFVGWSVGSSSSAAYDPAQMPAALAFDSSVPGVTSGRVTLIARYAPVPQGSYLVRFKVDDTVRACVVPAGQVPAYSSATAGAYAAPSKANTETGYNFIFKGWYAGSKASSDWQEGDELYSSALPAASGDAVYTAEFQREAAQRTVQFVVYAPSASGYDLTTANVRTVTGADVNDIARTYAQVGDQFAKDGYIYTFEGWGVRSTDAEPLYTDDLPLVAGSDGNFNSGSTYYGVYSKKEQKIDVTFYVDGQAYATASGVSPTTTIDRAFAGSSNAQNPPDKSDTLAFLGWAASPDAAEALHGGAQSVGGVLDGSLDSLSLYAVYGSPQRTVSLFSADGGLLQTVPLTAGQTISQGLDAAGETVSVPGKGGSYFAGWYTGMNGTGERVYPQSTPIDKTMRLYAAYGALTADTSEAPGVTADLSDAYQNGTTPDGLDSARFTVKQTAAVDSVLASSVSSRGYLTFRAYDVQFETDPAAPGVSFSSFGTVTIGFPVGTGFSESKVCVFWLKADGSVGQSAVKTVENGQVSVTVNGLSASDEGANFVVGYVQGAGTAGDLSGAGGHDNGGGGPTGDSGAANHPFTYTEFAGYGPASALASGLSAGGLTSGPDGGGLAAGGGAAAGLAAGNGADGDAGDAGAGSADGQDADGSGDGANDGGAASDGDAASDPGAEDMLSEVNWNWNALLFLAVFIAALAALGRFLWWLLVARRREDDAADDAELLASSQESVNF